MCYWTMGVDSFSGRSYTRSFPDGMEFASYLQNGNSFEMYGHFGFPKSATYIIDCDSLTEPDRVSLYFNKNNIRYYPSCWGTFKAKAVEGVYNIDTLWVINEHYPDDSLFVTATLVLPY